MLMGLLGGPTNWDEEYEEPSQEERKAYAVQERLWRAGFRVEYYQRRDMKWQCEITNGILRATSLEGTWAAAVLKADENLSKGIDGPEIEQYRRSEQR
jgi:hypothetical protein